MASEVRRRPLLLQQRLGCARGHREGKDKSKHNEGGGCVCIGYGSFIGSVSRTRGPAEKKAHQELSRLDLR